MIVTTGQLYKVAYKKFAVGAYNINNLEQTMGLFRGNVQSKAPFIIQLSKGARGYTDKRMLEATSGPRSKFFRKRSSPCISITATNRLATTASIPASTARS
jgi:fructose-bisphosphate aldolase class II